MEHKLNSDMRSVCSEENIKNIMRMSVEFDIYSNEKKFYITIWYRQLPLIDHVIICKMGKIYWNSVNIEKEYTFFSYGYAPCPYPKNYPKRKYSFVWTGEPANVILFDEFKFSEEILDI